MATTRAIHDIEAEVRRQRTDEGWTEEHDDAHEFGELSQAGACYALHASLQAWRMHDADIPYADENTPEYWPVEWESDAWKPKNPRKDLVRAAALIVAEIERLDRAEEREA